MTSLAPFQSHFFQDKYCAGILGRVTWCTILSCLCREGYFLCVCIWSSLMNLWTSCSVLDAIVGTWDPEDSEARCLLAHSRFMTGGTGDR
jgi:hypothetical protein